MPSTATNTASPLWVTIAFATVYLVWGSTYFFIRFAMQGGFPPFLLGAVRFIIAGLIMMAWCVIKKEKLFNRRDMITAAVTGVLLLFIANGIVIWSEKTLPSAMVAILASSAPIWFVLLDKPHWGVNFRSTSTITGLIMGFGGVMLLFSEQLSNLFKSADAQSKLPWMLLLIFGTISWSAGSIYSKNRGSASSTSVSSAWQMLAAGFVYVPVSFLHGEYKGLHIQNIHASGWMGLIYLIIFGSIAGFSAYVWLLQVRPATQVSTYAYVNPVIAVILGIFFGGEHISITQIGGLAVILLSVLLINLSKYRKEKKAVALVVD